VSRTLEIDRDLVAGWPLPALAGEVDKESRGRVLAVGGGAGSLGAGLLTGLADLRSGAGKLQLAAPAGVAAALAVALPEARIIPTAETPEGEIAAEAADLLAQHADRSDAVVIGPGLVDEGEAAELARRLMTAARPVFLLDSAAMTGLRHDSGAAAGLGGRLILTPHAGEMAALMDLDKAEVQADPLEAARRTAARFKAVVVMKGATTHVVSPDGRAWRHGRGPIGLGACGSGDVLAGLMAGLAARGASPVQAAVWAVYAHGEAGVRLSCRIAPLGFLAREILDELAPILGELQEGGREDPRVFER
jgi:ADP-dependent NAD(P)H-hydrate dehydratase